MASPCFRWLPLPEGPESRATGGDGAGVVPDTTQTKDGDTSTNGATSSEQKTWQHVLLLRAEDAEPMCNTFRDAQHILCRAFPLSRARGEEQGTIVDSM